MSPNSPDADVRFDDDAKTCEVHGLKLERDEVEVVYGLPPFDEERMEALENFPYANSRAGGGCVISDDSPARVGVLYCRACREAEGEWEAERNARKASKLPLRGGGGWVN